jgi:hypothetical protein
MKKILFCVLIIAATLVVVSCGGKDEKELSSINPGLYEINFDVKYAGQLMILKQRVRYGADYTFSATNFENNVPVEELKGKYKVENNQLVSYDNEQRLIKVSEKWEKKDLSKVDIRKLRKESFEYYFKFPNEQAREKLKGLGLSEGWKAYKRVSD